MKKSFLTEFAFKKPSFNALLWGYIKETVTFGSYEIDNIYTIDNVTEKITLLNVFNKICEFDGMITTSNGIFFPNGFQLQFKR